MPALQKAETELKTEIHMPFNPNSGTKTVIYISAPIASTTSAPIITLFINFTIPDNEFKLNESCINILLFTPILFPSSTIIPAAIVITPRPPT